MSNNEIIIEITTDVNTQFHIILPESFIKLPPSINHVFEDDIIACWLDNTIIKTYKHKIIETPSGEQFMAKKIRIWVQHETDGQYTVLLPNEIETATHAKATDINNWLNENLYDIKTWGITQI